MRVSPTGLNFWPREGSWTVGGRGEPGLTQGRHTENHDNPRLTSRVAVRASSPSHSYHLEDFYTGARSPVRRRLLRGSKVQHEAARWQQGKEGGCYVAAGYGRWVQEQAAMWQHRTGGGYSRRLLCGSRLQEEVIGGGRYVAPGCRRVLLCGSRVKEEAAMWQ